MELRLEYMCACVCVCIMYTKGVHYMYMYNLTGSEEETSSNTHVLRTVHYSKSVLGTVKARNYTIPCYKNLHVDAADSNQ